MGGESTPVAQRIKPTKKIVLVFVRIPASSVNWRSVCAGAEMRVQAGILMSLQFDLSGRFIGRIPAEIRALADAAQILEEDSCRASRMRPRQANDGKMT